MVSGENGAPAIAGKGGQARRSVRYEGVALSARLRFLQPGAGADPGFTPDERGGASDYANSELAREAAQALVSRGALAVVAYPVLILMVILASPEARSRMVFNGACLAYSVLFVAARLRMAARFERSYGIDPQGWWNRFRLGVGTIGLVWVAFAIHEMNTANEAWLTWMLLLLVNAGLAAGACTSLCPDPLLMRAYFVLAVFPPIVWALAQGGAERTAMAVAMFVYLVFIQAQAHHNSRAFWRSIRDKQAVRLAGERRDSVVNSIEGIVWEADLERSRFTFVSGRAESILGYPVEQWMSEPLFWAGRIHAEDRELATQYAGAESVAGRSHTQDYRMTAADGRTVWLRDIVSTGRNGAGEPALRGVMLDVTAQKRASEERALLAQALRTVSEAVTVADLDGRILFANDSFLRLHGYTLEEVLGRDIGIVFPARTSPELQQTIRAATKAGGWQGEVWQRHKDGREYPASLSTSLVRDGSGRVVATIAVASDITGRKRAENELRQAKEAAESANRAKSDFLANMSHEIRTPMNGVVGMAQLLLDMRLDPQQHRCAEVLRDSAGALLSILNDILDLSRIEAGKAELESATFDLHSVTGAVCDLMAVKAHEKGLELLCLIEPGVPSALFGDSGRLRQVLMNLVSNAVAFTDTGTISIRVRLETAGHPAVLRFEVRDTGAGVPEEKQALLFEAFSQADASAARPHGGTGLGLAIVRRLVAMMGGKAGFESVVGQGSCFWFTAEFHPGAEREEQTPAMPAGKRILIAGGSEAGRSHLERLAAICGCHVEAVEDVAPALAGNRRYDAAVVDAGLGGEALPSALTTSGIPVVLVAQGNGRDRQAQPEVAAVLTKPVKQRELAASLAALCGAVSEASPETPNMEDSTCGRSLNRGARLLLVEDNLTNQEVATGILEQLGYTSVKVVEDGERALEALDRAEFDLVLMDCQLPGMDGYEATRRIRDGRMQTGGREIPVVAMTAHALTGDREKCLAAGMNDYVTKPVSVRGLAAALRRWLP
jgi:PAS domain S-box-containing protein